MPTTTRLEVTPRKPIHRFNALLCNAREFTRQEFDLIWNGRLQARPVMHATTQSAASISIHILETVQPTGMLMLEFMLLIWQHRPRMNATNLKLGGRGEWRKQ